MQISREEMLYLQGEPATHAFIVQRGAARLHSTNADGRRQIIGFVCPGDWLGITGLPVYTHTAEALTDTRVLPISLSALTARARADAHCADCLLAQVTLDRQRMEEQVLMMGARSACERVAAFLVTYGARLPGGSAPDGAWEVCLPMDRLDIADLLGLTIENVSRKFTELKRAGVIALPTPSRVRFRDPLSLVKRAFGDVEDPRGLDFVLKNTRSTLASANRSAER